MKRKIFKEKHVVDETINGKLYRIISKEFIPDDKVEEKLNKMKEKKKNG